jgi:putative copper export protein
MDRAHWIGLAVLVGLLVFQVWVTLRVWRSPLYERGQKLNQAKLIWLLPVLGAAVAFSVLTDEERAERDQRKPPSQLRS